MKKLTETQKNFLLVNFFSNELFPGWENIAKKLIDYGNCVVAGETCIWSSNLSCFIETKKEDKFIGCLLYEFDLNKLLSSEWYKVVKNNYLLSLAEQKKKIELRISEISSLS